MICQNCGKHEATICIVKITNNKMEKKYICPICASKINNMKECTNRFNKKIEKLKIKQNTMIELVTRIVKSNQVDISMVFKALLTQNEFKNIWI